VGRGDLILLNVFEKFHEGTCPNLARPFLRHCFSSEVSGDERQCAGATRRFFRLPRLFISDRRFDFLWRCAHVIFFALCTAKKLTRSLIIQEARFKAMIFMGR
jgi:hypothetical protein